MNIGTAQNLATPFDDALARRRTNPGQKWPEPGPDCRLVPECWPKLKPSFNIAPDATIFAMGSCFARNIERHLANIGFKVPTISILHENSQKYPFAIGGLLNIYSPTAMRQELQWARAIFDRDDTMREEDVLPLLIETEPGKYVDVHLNPGVVTTTELEDQVARRRLLYSINREAFLSDVVVFTLGYVEVWWSVKTGKSIQLHSKLQRLADKSDIIFRRLRHAEVYESLAEAVRLVQRDRPTKIMLTTSPVPLFNTFTEDDVIVANSYSKSVLRAAAGDIAEDFDGVDYVPSYEAVTMTRSEHVWERDLIHVSSAFVNKIMAYVADHYAKSADYTESNRVVIFGSAVRSADWETADKLFDEVMASQRGGGLSLDAQTLILNYMKARRPEHEVDLQFTKVLSALEAEAQLPRAYFQFAVLATRLGKLDAAERLRNKTAAFLGRDPLALNHLVSAARLQGLDKEVDWLLEKAEPALAGNPEGLLALARAHESRGRIADYRRLKAAALSRSDSGQAVWAFSMELEKAGELSAALAMLSEFCKLNDDPIPLRRLVLLLKRDKRSAEAMTLLARRLAAHPDDSMALDLRALLDRA